MLQTDSFLTWGTIKPEIEKSLNEAYEQGRRHGEEKYKPLMAAVIDFLSSDHESEEEDIKYNFLKQVFDTINKQSI